MNNAVDVIFSWSETIIQFFSSAYDFFMKPVSVGFGHLFDTGIIPTLLGKALDEVGVNFNFEFSLIELIMGPGLKLFLLITFISWFTDVLT